MKLTAAFGARSVSAWRQVDAPSSGVTSMPVRGVVLFNLDAPFGGFRAAGPPGLFGLDDPKAFAVLERAIESAFTLFSAHQPADWPVIAPTGFAAAVPCLEDREGFIDYCGSAVTEGHGEVILRACLPFRAWPLGGWVVFEGRHRALDGSWRPFTPEELAELW